MSQMKFCDITSGIKPERRIDWEACVLCQVVTVEHLVVPSKNKDSAASEQTYQNLANHLVQFLELESLPYHLK